MNWKMVGTLILAVGLVGACSASTQSSPSSTRIPEKDEDPAATSMTPAAAQPVPTASGIILTDKNNPK